MDKAVGKIKSTYGMQTRVANLCGLSPQAVHLWKHVPAKWVHIVADTLKMSPEEIRPDIFKKRK